MSLPLPFFARVLLSAAICKQAFRAVSGAKDMFGGTLSMAEIL